MQGIYGPLLERMRLLVWKVLVNVTARSVKGNGLVLYNVVDNSEEGLTFADGEVC